MSATATRDYEMTKRDFERVRSLIHARAGISLAPGKQDMVYSRLVRRLRAVRMDSFSGYLDWLEREGGDEWEQFTNALTTNLTAFFREPHHFDLLKQQMAATRSRPFRIWCSASSTGEEPYSLAITAAEHYGSLHPPVEIVATDIDTQVLETAQRGIYPMDRAAKLEPARLRQFFRKGAGANDGYCRVVPELREMIQFLPLNLLAGQWDVHGPYDAIFCRNVMIYFDKPTQHRILSRFLPLLQPNGLMYAGHSESFFHAAELFRARGRTVYERADRARAAA